MPCWIVSSAPAASGRFDVPSAIFPPGLWREAGGVAEGVGEVASIRWRMISLPTGRAKTERRVVAGYARQRDLGMVECQVDYRNAAPNESFDKSVGFFVAAQCDERTVAAPAAREAHEAIDDRQVPAVGLGEPGDTLNAFGVGGLKQNGFYKSCVKITIICPCRGRAACGIIVA